MEAFASAGLLTVTVAALGLLATALFRLDGKIETLGARMDAGFGRLEGRIDRLEARFDARIDQLDAKLTEHLRHHP